MHLFIFIIEPDNYFYNNEKYVYNIEISTENKKTNNNKNKVITHYLNNSKESVFLFVGLFICLSVTFFRLFSKSYSYENSYKNSYIVKPPMAFYVINKDYLNNYIYKNDESYKKLSLPLAKVSLNSKDINYNSNTNFSNNLNDSKNSYKKKLYNWAEENISLNLDSKAELPMVTMATKLGAKKGSAFTDIFKKTHSQQGATIAARSTHGFLKFHESNPGACFNTQNAFAFMSPSIKIDLKTNNLHWSLYNTSSIHSAFFNNIFNRHYGFRNKFSFKYFFFDIFNKEVKYENTLSVNYNFIYNLEEYDNTRAGIKFSNYRTNYIELIWVCKNINSKFYFSSSCLPFQKNKLELKLCWDIHNGDEATIKNYRSLQKANKDMTTKQLSLAAMNTSSSGLTGGNLSSMETELKQDNKEDEMNSIQSSDYNLILNNRNNSDDTIQSEITKKRVVVKQKNPKGLGNGLNKDSSQKELKKNSQNLINILSDISIIVFILDILTYSIPSLNIHINLINNSSINSNNLLNVCRQILFIYIFGGAINLSVRLFNWFKKLGTTTEIVPLILDNINHTALNTNQTFELSNIIFLNIGILFILIQLKSLGIGNLPIIREFLKIIVTLLEKLEKNIFNKKNNNNSSPPENGPINNSSNPKPDPNDGNISFKGVPSNQTNISSTSRFIKPKVKKPKISRIIKKVILKFTK